MSEINNVNYYSLEITRPDDETVLYYFDEGSNSIVRTDSSVSGPVNSDEVLVSGRFYSEGVGSGDSQQPRITIVLKVETTGDNVEDRAELNLQTTVSLRNIEL